MWIFGGVYLIVLCIGGALILLFNNRERINKITSILGICVCLLTIILAPFSKQPRISGTLGLSFKIIGGFLTIIGISFITFSGKSLLKSARFNPALVKGGTPKKLITTGLYSKVRNPIYTGVILLAIGWCLVWSAVYSFFLIPLIVYLALAFLVVKRAEEPRLIQLFGKEYEEYKKRVPAFFPIYLKIALLMLIVSITGFTIIGWIPVD
jgi:protein-S-isoprenylcysteine O-methyltransferase Ste14